MSKKDSQKVVLRKRKRNPMISEIKEPKADYGTNVQYVGTDVQIPKFIKPQNKEAYRAMIEACLNFNMVDHGSYSTFADAHGISRRTLYKWLRADDTIKIIDEVIEAQVVADKPAIKQLIRNNMAKNPAYARLYAEKYENWKPEQPSHQTINIQFNFPDAPKKPVEVTDADVEDA